MEYYGANYNNMNCAYDEPYRNEFCGHNAYRNKYRRGCPAFDYYREPFAVPNFKEVNEEELFG
ncbi:hypothetical protein KYB31_04440 [Clostridium felsineum]|uniref:hypothetical protein n=1 Tax=Clostridium felsineum TaxID=36839 RepID=UPI00098CEB6B|nr:hypothetical protein [Clostridium felsineum]MCR3758247.1 hypothetical protein [Clostridium felsineum]URZ01201.1 hypothetical protein CLAUR_011890 [Clostridium felsineum]URZ15709.1 hypothetical protein CLFE_017560 [Clostridium felsineum DSM 794]